MEYLHFLGSGCQSLASRYSAGKVEIELRRANPSTVIYFLSALAPASYRYGIICPTGPSSLSSKGSCAAGGRGVGSVSFLPWSRPLK